MKLRDLIVGMKIKGGTPERVWLVTAFNESCLLLKAGQPIKVADNYDYTSTYLPTVFLEAYEPTEDK